MLGVRMPILRQIARQISQSECWREFVSGDKSGLYEIEMLRGIVIAISKCDILQRQKNSLKFVNEIDNWGICDSFCASFKLNKTEKDVLFKFIKECHKSPKEYVRRYAVVMMLMHYIDDEYIEEALRLLTGQCNHSHIIQMASAWGLSVAYIKYPSSTLRALRTNKMDKITLKYAIQKIRDSRRIPLESREVIISEIKKHI